MSQASCIPWGPWAGAVGHAFSTLHGKHGWAGGWHCQGGGDVGEEQEGHLEAGSLGQVCLGHISGANLYPLTTFYLFTPSFVTSVFILSLVRIESFKESLSAFTLCVW